MGVHQVVTKDFSDQKLTLQVKNRQDRNKKVEKKKQTPGISNELSLGKKLRPRSSMEICKTKCSLNSWDLAEFTETQQWIGLHRMHGKKHSSRHWRVQDQLTEPTECLWEA